MDSTTKWCCILRFQIFRLVIARRLVKHLAMDKDDDLLARELGKLGAFGGALGDALGGSIGGYLGASLTARFLPTERYQIELKLRADQRLVLTKVYDFFTRNGRVIDSEEQQASPYPTISGLVGSGFLNMNPAIVHAEIMGIDGPTCRVVLTGAAKEGAIKQHAAEIAVNRLAEVLDVLT